MARFTSKKVSTDFSFDIGDVSFVARLSGIYRPYIPATRIDPAEGDVMEDIELVSLQLKGQVADLPRPTWLSDALTASSEVIYDLLSLGREEEEPSEKEDR